MNYYSAKTECFLCDKKFYFGDSVAIKCNGCENLMFNKCYVNPYTSIFR